MAASAVPLAGTVEVHQMGDVTVGEQTDLVLVDNGKDTAALVEKKTTVAAVPVEGGTAVVRNVEYTPLAAATYTQEPEEHTDNYQSTQRIPSNVNRQRTAPPPRPHPPAPPPYQPLARPTRTPRQRTNRNINDRTPWDKCRRCFYIIWLFLITCLGLAGLLFIGLGELTRKCNIESKRIAVFDLWTSSFVTGAVMVLFTLCVWLSCGAYHCCFKRQRELCIGLVIGCGIVGAFFFIIAYGFNISSVGQVVDTPPASNSTSHDSDCLSPYWLAYVPSFALGVVILAAIFSLCCCLCCKICFRCYCGRRKGYERLP